MFYIIMSNVFNSSLKIKIIKSLVSQASKPTVQEYLKINSRLMIITIKHFNRIHYKKRIYQVIVNYKN